MGRGTGGTVSTGVDGDHAEHPTRAADAEPVTTASHDFSGEAEERARRSGPTAASSRGNPSPGAKRERRTPGEAQSCAPSSVSDSSSAKNRRRRRRRAPENVTLPEKPASEPGRTSKSCSPRSRLPREDETAREISGSSEGEDGDSFVDGKGEPESLKIAAAQRAPSLPSSSSSDRNFNPRRSTATAADLLQRKGLGGISHHPPPPTRPPPLPPCDSRPPLSLNPVMGALASPSSRDGSPTASMVRFGHAAFMGSKEEVKKEGEEMNGSPQLQTTALSVACDVAGKSEPERARGALETTSSTTGRSADSHPSEGTLEESATASPGLGPFGEDFELFPPPLRSRASENVSAWRPKSRDRQSDQLNVPARPDKPQEVAERPRDSGPSAARSTLNPPSNPRSASHASPGSRRKQNTPSFLRRSSQLQWPAGVSPSILYVGEPERSSGENTDLVTQTQLAKIPLEDDQRDLVFGDSSFQIQVVGLHIGDDEETAVSGLAKLGLATQSPSCQRHRVLYSTRKDPSDGASATIPAVHYDSIRRESRNRMNREYIHVSTDKGSVTRGRGGSREVLSLAMQFVLFQIQGSELGRNSVRATLENVDALNQTLDSLSSTDAPYYALLAPFVRISGGLGTAALEQAGCKSRLLDADISFRLVSRDPTMNPVGEAFLRFGYYFILSEPCQDKLFTQVAASENIRLFTRREKDGSLHPTKHLTYVVVRVSEQIRLSSQQQVPPVLAPGSETHVDSPVHAAFTREQSRKAYSRGVFPPLQDAVGDMEVLRQALHDAREAPAEDFRDRILALMSDLRSTR